MYPHTRTLMGIAATPEEERCFSRRAKTGAVALRRTRLEKHLSLPGPHRFQYPQVRQIDAVEGV
jgi:hypothetical protein